MERYFTLEGLASQAASTGRRTGSCCCSCKSAISVGEARWSGPLRLPQCRTAPLHCPSAFRQLFYTVSVPPDSSSTLSQCPQTAPLHCLSAPRQLFYTVSVPPDSSSTLSQCPQTAPLHCFPVGDSSTSVSVPPDSSSTLSQCPQTAPLHCLSAPRQLLYTVSLSLTLLLPVLLASARFEGELGGEWGKQARGCYNITFICTKQETV